MGSTNVKKACPVCGRSFTKNGLPGHMRFKHNTDTRGQRRLDKVEPVGMLSEEATKCKACGSMDVDAVGLTGELVKLQGEVDGDRVLRDTKLVTRTVQFKVKLSDDKTVNLSKPVRAQLAERAPTGKKFLKLKCRQCGAEHTATIAIT